MTDYQKKVEASIELAIGVSKLDPEGELLTTVLQSALEVADEAPTDLALMSTMLVFGSGKLLSCEPEDWN